MRIAIQVDEVLSRRRPDSFVIVQNPGEQVPPLHLLLHGWLAKWSRDESI